MVPEVLKVYTTKSAEEQSQIVSKFYREDAHFVDPLMDVKTPREIHLAFFSLIKLFKDVEVHQKAVALNPKPRLPKTIKAADVQQFIVNNQQKYTFARSSFVSRCFLPSVVDLDVSTFLTIDPASGRILYHEDVWNNNGFRFPSFLKGSNGVVSSLMFKGLGWGKQIDNASGQRSSL
jgi:hypothetical protein